jgi:hypothetical protein
MPSFTAALKTRAPSRWMESLRAARERDRVGHVGARQHLPPMVFSSASSRVIAKCESSGLIAPSTIARSSEPSGRFCSGCGWIEPSTAMPPAS